MEGSAIAKTREIIRRDTHEILRRAGLPANAALAWTKARPRVTNAFKRDTSAGTKFWRRGTELLAKLPEKPKRTPEQQVALSQRITKHLQASFGAPVSIGE